MDGRDWERIIVYLFIQDKSVCSTRFMCLVPSRQRPEMQIRSCSGGSLGEGELGWNLRASRTGTNEESEGGGSGGRVRGKLQEVE